MNSLHNNDKDEDDSGDDHYNHNEIASDSPLHVTLNDFETLFNDLILCEKGETVLEFVLGVVQQQIHVLHNKVTIPE